MKRETIERAKNHLNRLMQDKLKCIKHKIAASAIPNSRFKRKVIWHQKISHLTLFPSV